MCDSFETAPQGQILRVFHHQYLFASKWEMVFILRSTTIKFHSFPPEADLYSFPSGNYRSLFLYTEHRTQWLTFFPLSDLCMAQCTINKIHPAIIQCPCVDLQRTALPITNCSSSALHKMPNTMQSMDEGKANMKESICNFFLNYLNISCQLFYRIMRS